MTFNEYDDDDDDDEGGCAVEVELVRVPLISIAFHDLLDDGYRFESVSKDGNGPLYCNLVHDGCNQDGKVVFSGTFQECMQWIMPSMWSNN